MNFHEYQAKEIFASYGIPIPAGIVAKTVEQAVAAAEKLGGDAWVVKAQVHAGGRGKAGGVKFSTSLDAVKENAQIKDIHVFNAMSDVIVANRLSEDLLEVQEKVYTRDIFREN